MSYSPSKAIQPMPARWYEPAIALRPGDKFTQFRGHQSNDFELARTLQDAAEIKTTETSRPKKKDPRTFIGWALKAFYD